MRKFVYILCVFVAAQAEGAVPKKALDKKVNAYVNDGIIIGGRAGQAYSLLNVRRDVSPKIGMERVILDIGDMDGRPLRGGVAYFQASVEKNPARVVLDLAQVNRSAVTEAKLKKAFLKSPYVKSVELMADPEDRSATMVLNLKENMGVEVFEMPSTTRASRIVIDLKKEGVKTVGARSK